MSAPSAQPHRALVRRVLLACAGSFVFCFALIPLYSIYCEITGINGKTGAQATAAARESKVDRTRSITVQFDANVRAGLPWSFTPRLSSMSVHPGEVVEAFYDATNNGSERIVGQAVPSVAPNRASMYFNKTECFCFTEQPLDAGETRAMPLRFVIDPELPANVQVLTLSYSFYRNELATRRLASHVSVTDNPAY